MVDRRLMRPTDERQHDALKAVAGLITKLSFRDMEKLGRKVADLYADASAPSLTYALLDAADNILKEDSRHDFD